MWLRSAQCSLLLLGILSPANGLIHQQVAFDNSDVCWWGLMPPDLVCPILNQQNLTELAGSIAGTYAWEGGDKCEGAFCLYSNQGFAGGRGIAVITTPPNYDRVKAVGDLLKDHGVSFKDTDSYPFHITEIEGKGNGIVADQALKRGDPIMGHTPVLLVHRAFKEATPQSQQQRLVQAAIDSLPKTTADLFMAQMAHIPEKHRNAAMLTTNAFLLNLKTDTGGDDGSGHHFGAFPEVARLNHDCRPNAVYRIDSATLMHITTAVSAIEPGEEITISYLDPLLPREQRQERLRKDWRFECNCDQCSLSDDEHEHSETRLKEIKWIEAKLTDYSEHRGISTGLITYLLGLYENEGLYCCLGRAYKLAALNFNGLGYEKQAKMYAELAIEALKLEKGEGAAADISDLEALIKRPNKHWTFSGRLVNIR
ncbi:SET domain-containing protein 5 [Gnomoniopsis sp. IMI 355080]|nr:SET domain-containing protein 5 [Gnomoniopsis sp. IMI 355080]